jgi:hypothetical protein
MSMPYNPGAVGSSSMNQGLGGYQNLSYNTNLSHQQPMPGQVDAYNRMVISSTPPSHVPMNPGMQTRMPLEMGSNDAWNGSSNPDNGGMSPGVGPWGAGMMPTYAMGGGQYGNALAHSQRIQAMRAMKIQAAKNQLLMKKKREDAEYKQVVLQQTFINKKVQI